MDEIKLSAHSMNMFFGKKQILKNININFPKSKVTSLIGPSGCGKSTLLRSFNRMHDLSPDARIEGDIKLDDLDIYDKKNSVTEMRKRIGMVFQKPNPLPKSIYENLSYALSIHKFPKKEIPELIDIKNFKSGEQFLAGSHDQIMLNYMTAKHEVKNWYTKEKSDKFIKDINSGQTFKEAFGQ